MGDGAIQVKLSLKGRPIREFVFAEPRVTIGRDPQSHIFLDNAGISRCHALLVREEDGLYLDDQESANGTFLNDVPVTRAHVKEGDRIRIGKFLLVLGSARRAGPDGETQPAPFPESTMVLEPAQIDRLRQQAQVLPLHPNSTTSVGNAQPQSEAGAGVTGIAAWVRAHVIAIEIGFTAGLAAGVVIAKTLLG